MIPSANWHTGAPISRGEPRDEGRERERATQYTSDKITSAAWCRCDELSVARSDETR